MYGAGLCAPIPPGAPRPRPSVQKAYAEVAVGVALAQLTRRLRSETWSKTLSAPPSCWVLVLYAAHVQSPRAVPTCSPHGQSPRAAAAPGGSQAASGSRVAPAANQERRPVRGGLSVADVHPQQRLVPRLGSSGKCFVLNIGWL